MFLLGGVGVDGENFVGGFFFFDLVGDLVCFFVDG